MVNAAYPLVRNCVLISTGTIGVEVSNSAVLVDNQIEASTNIYINTGGRAFVSSSEGITYDGPGDVEPLSGDRSVWDALNYQARHANDVNAALGIHHTLASLDSRYSLSALTDAHIFVGNASNVAADVAMSGDATIDNAGLVTVVGLQGRDVDSAAPSDGQALTWDSGTNKWTPGAAGHVIQDEGVALPTEPNLNFTGNLVTVSDNAGSSRTDVTIQASIPINVYNETQTADGTSLTYYLANYAAPATIRVYIDGIRQPASDDSAATDIVTFTIAPAADALLMFDYELELA